MITFALVSEGITDQVALDQILQHHYSGNDVEINPLQPLRDATDDSRQVNHGGWENVIEYCSTAEFEQVLDFNDYMIIQIDTDQADHKNFGVGLHVEGRRKDIPTLINDVKDFLKGKLSPPFLEMYADKLLFAICVDSLECWILPAFKAAKNEKTHNCEGALTFELRKKENKLEKKYDFYDSLFSSVLASPGLNFLASNSTSLKLFLESLPVIDATTEPVV